MKTTTRSAALLLSLGIGLFAAAGPASAATSIVGISNGTLVARGAGVEVSYSFICDEGREVGSFVTISQRVAAGRVAKGGGGNDSTAPCTGKVQTIKVTAVADSSAFKKGPALATVFLFSCDAESCTNIQTTKEIRLTSR